MASKIVLTGGAGFIGANLLRAFAGKSVVVFDNFSRGDRRNIPHGVAVVEGDIRDLKALQQATRGADIVIHLAAYGSVIESIEDPLENFDVNARGIQCVLDACRTNEVDRFIFASTGGALIGNAPLPVNEKSLPNPISPYGASKLCGEAYCHAYAESYGIRTTILRFANIYGPYSGHKKGAITRFMKAIIKNEPIIIFGDGSSTRDYLYSEDLCKGIVTVLASNLAPGEIFHMASGVETSIRDLVAMTCAAAGIKDHPIIYRPNRRGEVQRNFASYDKAAKLIGFRPATPLHEGLVKMWNWFMENREAILNAPESES